MQIPSGNANSPGSVCIRQHADFFPLSLHFSFPFFFYFKAQVGFKLAAILLSQPPECGDCRGEPI